jgi:hypothetical protein
MHFDTAYAFDQMFHDGNTEAETVLTFRSFISNIGNIRLRAFSKMSRRRAAL